MDRRTSLITAGAVAGVLLAGSAAVAANIGILNTAGDDSVGNLSANASLTTAPDPAPSTADAQVIDVYVEDPRNTTIAELVPVAAADPAMQDFKVDSAGIVSVLRTDSGILLGGVAANPGWEWTGEQVSPSEFTVTFTSGDRTFVFVASLEADGTIAARVDQPIVNIVHTPANTTPNANTANATASPDPYDEDYDDHEEYEDDDHEEHDHDEEYDDDHEGRDDDD